ncbi:MAG TPA: response regulator [Burkholderiales bacterium]|jgi:DNA-binding NtrC family response regulator|nr:response regulator [Burkholderiales bacterium]
MNERVLLIDDDPGVSEVIGLLLERENYRVERAGSVRSAIERLQAAEFELVVTDLKLPDGTGLDVIGAVRSRRPRLPIMMITSYSSVDSAIAALRGGAVDYVIKPFNNDDFLRAVSRALKIRVTALSGARPLPVEAYIREVVERFQDSTSEIELARMLGIGRKALWMRRRQWGLKRSRKSVS